MNKAPLSTETMIWRPIATAPTDRTILVYRPEAHKAVETAKWNPDEYSKRPRPYWDSYFWGTTRDRGSPPTHWMPLPEPPSHD